MPDRDNPWEWWLAVGRNRYPILFKMAIDYLSCPCTSCDCERAFSSARRTITDDRNGLGSETIEATQLLKNWLRRDVVKSSLRDLEKHVQKLDKTCDSEVELLLLHQHPGQHPRPITIQLWTVVGPCQRYYGYGRYLTLKLSPGW